MIQALDVGVRIADVVQGLVALGTATAIGLLWSMGNRLTRIETKLGVDESGNGALGEIRDLKARLEYLERHGRA